MTLPSLTSPPPVRETLMESNVEESMTVPGLKRSVTC